MHLVVLLYALFASVFTIAKTGLEYAQPCFLVGARMMIAGVIMLGYQYMTNRGGFRIRSQDMWLLIGLAFFNIYLTNVCEFWGLQYLTSFKTCFIYSLSPFIAALLSYLINSETLNGKKIIGLLIGFGGLTPILMYESAGEEQMGHLFIFSWAELALMVAAVSTVYGWILMQRLVKEKEYSPIMANGCSMLLGGAMATVHSGFTENWNPIPVTDMVPFLVCTALLTLISNLVCYNLYGYLLKRYSATFMSFSGFMTPFFAALFGWFYLGETVSWHFYLSAIIVFSGLVVFYLEELGQGYAQETQAEPV